MTRPGIEPRSPGLLANTLPTRLVSRFTINKSAHTKKVWKLIICTSYIYIYIYIYITCACMPYLRFLFFFSFYDATSFLLSYASLIYFFSLNFFSLILWYDLSTHQTALPRITLGVENFRHYIFFLTPTHFFLLTLFTLHFCSPLFTLRHTCTSCLLNPHKLVVKGQYVTHVYVYVQAYMHIVKLSAVVDGDLRRFPFQ